MNKTVIYKLKERKRIMFGKNRSPESESKKKESPEIKLTPAGLGRPLTKKETSSLEEVGNRAHYFNTNARGAIKRELTDEQAQDIRQSLSPEQQLIFDQIQRDHLVYKRVKDTEGVGYEIAAMIALAEMFGGSHNPDIHAVLRAIIDSKIQ
jgi:hypothetical protein